MSRTFSTLVCTLLLQLPFLSGQSLDSLKVSVEVRGVSLTDIFQQLEIKYGLRFYYPPESLPKKALDARIIEAPLPDALRQLLASEGLDFFFYRSNAIVVAHAAVVNTDYSPGFYKAVKDLSAQAGQGGAMPETGAQALTIGDINNISPNGEARVRIAILDAQNGEPIAQAAVQWEGFSEQNKYTDGQGQLDVILPIGLHKLKARQVGYAAFDETVRVFNDGDLTIKLAAHATQLAEVLVKAESPDVNISSAEIGVARLDPKAIKRSPTLLGEADVVRSLLLSTGVTSVGEGAAGFNVRGGETDHNLLLQDEMVLFNSTHALGFFSTYNADLVQNIELYKSIIPAQYGGRLASVLDVEMRDGSFEKWKIQGGIGPVTGRLSVEGPVLKNKSSLIAGVRASYADWVLQLAKKVELKRSSASFYDANIRYVHRFNAKNSLIVSGYAAADQFEYNRSFGFDYRTVSGQVTWKHFIREDFYSNFSIVGSQYKSSQSDLEGTDGGQLDNGIDNFKIKERLTWQFRRGLKFDAGLESILYKIQPGAQQPLGPVSLVVSKVLEKEKGLESAIFGNAEWIASPRWTLICGLRWNDYRFLGPKTVFAYDPVVAPDNISDTLSYRSGQTIARYSSFEPRFSSRYRLTANSSIKAGYSRTSQFVNQIFNTDTPTPTSQYQLSTGHIEPFRSHNFAAGYFRNTKDNLWETSAEVFYRAIDKLWDYRDFARLTVNEQLETEIRYGRGLAYGLELSAKTTRQLYNGQVGYTFSRAKRSVAGINNGDWYPSNFDKPHVFNLVFNYQPNQRHTLTFHFTYSTGRPTTAPLTSYRLQNNLIVPVYAPRNQVRIPDYHRLDVSYTIGRGYNKRKTLKTSWNFSLYNVYARRNAFSVFYVQDPYQKAVANRLSVLGTIFPAITINFETI